MCRVPPLGSPAAAAAAAASAALTPPASAKNACLAAGRPQAWSTQCDFAAGDGSSPGTAGHRPLRQLAQVKHRHTARRVARHAPTPSKGPCVLHALGLPRDISRRCGFAWVVCVGISSTCQRVTNKRILPATMVVQTQHTQQTHREAATGNPRLFLPICNAAGGQFALLLGRLISAIQ